MTKNIQWEAIVAAFLIGVGVGWIYRTHVDKSKLSCVLTQDNIREIAKSRGVYGTNQAYTICMQVAPGFK